MKKKKDKIIQAPILSLSAKIELVARFLRKKISTSTSVSKKEVSTQESAHLKTKNIASKNLQNQELPTKKEETA